MSDFDSFPHAESDSLDDLGASMLDSFRIRVGQLVKGTAEDVQRYAAAMMADMAAAAAAGDTEGMRHLRAQAQLLEEAKRLELVGATWDQIGDIAWGIAEGVRIALLKV